MRILLSCLFLLALAVAAHAANPLPVDQISTPRPLLPYCDWLPDPEGQLTIDSIASDPAQQRFTPLPGRFPLKAEGPVWLRLVIVKSQPGPAREPADASRLSVSLGALPPGETTLYMSKAPGQLGGEEVWHAEQVFSHEILDLPEPGLLPVSVYIRMDETPGPWFAPTISAKSAVQPDVLPSELILPGLFIAACAACLLRALAERAQWALWSALFLLCALAQTLLPLPALSQGFRPEHLPALLAPGMALILLPHIGRCMFRASGLSPTRDAILYLCSFIGVAVALGPLLPGLAWLTRLFPLWPLLTAPLLPLCVSALAARQPGALAFSGACAMPLLGAGVALHALYSAPFMHPLAAQGSLWGLAVGGIGLALARIPSGGKIAARTDLAEAPAPAGLTLAESAVDAARTQAADSGLDLGETPAFTRRSQYDELPPLEVLRLGNGQSDTPCELPGLPDLAQFIQPVPSDQAAQDELEQPLCDAEPEPTPLPDDGPVPDLTYEEDIIATAQETPEAAPVTQEAQDAPEEPGLEPDRVISFMDDELSAFSAELREMEEEAARQTSFATESGFLFSLHSLVREVHSVVAPLAKNRGLVFSWYISPLLPPLLEGDAPRLRGALTLLLQNAVLATRKGAVHLAVRKNPGSSDPGNLLFVVADNGSAQRTEAGFFHAWEMAARTGGVFTVEYSPLGGTQISFTVRFALPSEQVAGELLGVVADSSSSPADESEDDDLMPVLNTIFTPAGGDWTALASPELSPSTESDWSMTPEQVLHEQGFLEPLPDPPVDEAPPAAPQNEGKALFSLFPATAEHAAPEAPAPADVAPVAAAPPVSDPAVAVPPPSGLRRIIASEMTTSNRRLLSHYLADLLHEHVSAATNAQVPDMFRAGPVSLIIFDGDTPEHDIIRALRAVRDEERKNGLSPTSVLVLTSHETQSERLLENGATHALIKPVSKEALYAIAAQTPPVTPALPTEASASALDAPHIAEETPPARPRATPSTTEYGNEREVDILAEALRDAPQQQGAPLEVSLPPRHGVATAWDGLAATAPAQEIAPPEHDALAHGDAAAAAPMLLTLSLEDVTPAPAQTQNDHPPAGSLLDFVLPDAASAAPPESHESGQDESFVPAAWPGDTPEEEQDAPEHESEDANGQDTPEQLPEQDTPEPEVEQLPEAEPEVEHLPEAEPEAAPETNTGHAQEPASFFPLPGLEGEALDVSVLPLTPGLIFALQEIMREIQQAAERGQSILIQEAAGRLAGKAEVFGLVKLGRIAHCVERAAEADDMEAVRTLLEDLGPVVTRYVQSLQECFNAFLYADR